MPPLHRVSVIVHGAVSVGASAGLAWSVHAGLEPHPLRRRRLAYAEPARRSIWRVQAVGMQGLHTCAFEPQPDGRVRIRSSLALDGWRVRLPGRRLLRRRLAAVLDAWLAALGARAELLAAAGRVPLRHESRWQH